MTLRNTFPIQPDFQKSKIHELTALDSAKEWLISHTYRLEEWYRQMLDLIAVMEDNYDLYLPLAGGTITGPLIFSGATGGLLNGEIKVESNATETAIAVSGTPVQVTAFDTVTHSNGMTASVAQSHIEVLTAGHYLVLVSATVNSVGGLGSKFEIRVMKNNGASDIIPHMDRNIAGGGGAAGVVSLSGIASLAVGDTIEVWIENETNTANYVVEDIALTAVMIGGN